MSLVVLARHQPPLFYIFRTRYASFSGNGKQHHGWMMPMRSIAYNEKDYKQARSHMERLQIGKITYGAETAPLELAEDIAPSRINTQQNMCVRSKQHVTVCQIFDGNIGRLHQLSALRHS